MSKLHSLQTQKSPNATPVWTETEIAIHTFFCIGELSFGGKLAQESDFRLRHGTSS